ncbi:hypothetical protein ACM01_27135 [Streptomyces viridochromogenes]|uniref:Uncharacterized protein n=1 Tax=Streptomyces viridochromogenes TaxID=1938 RepID=A0A0J7Z8C8_STRVR|nr:hypothetical protein [Streptomyces viridochromogenes]KMS71433.1 hypothetical protein ACM01_27135 [Streptomyces viridochromogenes]
MDTFASRLDGAWVWFDAAIEEAQEGRWVRDAVERQVMADIRAATNALHGGRPAPFTEDSWHVRIGRIANWAGVLRLAARAGGWELLPVVGLSPPHPAGMTELLSGIHAIGEQGERWMRQLREGVLPPEDEIAQAEGFLTGPGSVEDLELFFHD